jgi:hypothetical protein
MQKERPNSVFLKVINITLIILTLISWVKIASLNFLEPSWFDELHWELRIYPLHYKSMSKNYILQNFIPNFIQIFIFVSIFLVINIINGKINYIERNFMKITFYCIILTSILFIVVFKLPEPPYLILFDFHDHLTYIEVIQFYSSILSIIDMLLIFFSLIGLPLMSKLNINRKLDNLRQLKG